jgi:hypothetical protein
LARHEADREDLLAEATALVRRAELTGPGFTDPVVAGFRRDGSLSVYFGSDPAYHLDPQGRLKRAFHSGRLYRTQGETLAELTRERTATETTLRRRDLLTEGVEPFLAEMTGRMTNLLLQLRDGALRVTRQVPDSDESFRRDFDAAVDRMLDRARDGTPLAPRFKGKR